MERVVNQLEQGILRATSAGETLIRSSQNQRDMPEFRWEEHDLVMDGSKVLPDDDPEDRLGIDAVLALKMKWLVVNHERSYSLGPRLLLHYPKYPVVADQTGGKAFVVNGNVLFLAYLYNWLFVHLKDSFDEVTGWNGSPGYQPYTRPVHLYCNVGESSIVGNQITNFLRDLPYKDEPTWWEPQHVQYHRVGGDTVEIVEVEVSSKDGTLLNLNTKGETQVTLHFKA